MELKQITDRVSVTGQVLPDNVAQLKAAGFTTIVNNRPDGEEPGQPAGQEIAAAAEAQGLRYVEIPMGRDGVTPEMVDQTRAALDESDGKVLCFCRTGTRSTTLWALAQAGRMSSSDIVTAAANAGYDMNHLAQHLDETAR